MSRRKHIVRGGTGLIAIIIALVGAALSRSPALRQKVASSQPGLYAVVHVSDGDTIVVQLPNEKATVRLIGVDTPEVKDPRKLVQCFGEAASAHTKSLMNGQSVRLEADPLDSDKDKYGRLLRYVYLPDGTMLNSELIRDGFAFAYIVFPYQHMDEFKQLERDARSANRGLWAGCGVDESSKIKQTTVSK